MRLVYEYEDKARVAQWSFGQVRPGVVGEGPAPVGSCPKPRVTVQRAL